MFFSRITLASTLVLPSFSRLWRGRPHQSQSQASQSFAIRRWRNKIKIMLSGGSADRKNTSHLASVEILRSAQNLCAQSRCNPFPAKAPLLLALVGYGKLCRSLCGRASMILQSNQEVPNYARAAPLRHQRCDILLTQSVGIHFVECGYEIFVFSQFIDNLVE